MVTENDYFKKFLDSFYIDNVIVEAFPSFQQNEEISITNIDFNFSLMKLSSSFDEITYNEQGAILCIDKDIHDVKKVLIDIAEKLGIDELKSLLLTKDIIMFKFKSKDKIYTKEDLESAVRDSLNDFSKEAEKICIETYQKSFPKEKKVIYAKKPLNIWIIIFLILILGSLLGKLL